MKLRVINPDKSVLNRKKRLKEGISSLVPLNRQNNETLQTNGAQAILKGAHLSLTDGPGSTPPMPPRS